MQGDEKPTVATREPRYGDAHQARVGHRANWPVLCKHSMRFLFFRLRVAFRLKDTPSATIFTPVLLIAAAIGAIFNNIGAVADTTAVSDSFLDHAVSLPITYFPTTTKF